MGFKSGKGGTALGISTIRTIRFDPLNWDPRHVWGLKKVEPLGLRRYRRITKNLQVSLEAHRLGLRV